MKTALVDQALYWDATSFYPAIRAVIYPIVRGNGELNQDSVKTVDEKLDQLNQDLGRNEYVAGKELTIADLSVLAAWTSVEETGFFDTSKLTNIHAWFKRIKDSKRITQWDELVVDSAKAYGDIIRAKLAK